MGFKIGLIRGRREPRQCIMGPLFVIRLESFRTHLPDLIQRLERRGVEVFGAIDTINPLMKRF